MSVVAIRKMQQRGIYDEAVHPIIHLTESQINRINQLAIGRNYTGYESTDYDHNTVFSDAQTLHESTKKHEEGLLGEAAVSVHHSPDESIDGLDEQLSYTGDDGVDLLIDGWHVDVKTTTFGYERDRVPLLKVKRHKHQQILERIESGDVDELVYYLVEKMDSSTLRLVGYITVSRFEEVAERVRGGETYRPGEDGYDFQSRADNLVCEPEDLVLSYRDD